jgi:hypothetical protein
MCTEMQVSRKAGIRFGVRDGDRRSATWVVTPKKRSTGKNDVYVSCRELDGTIHISLHESGRWHVAYDTERATKGELFDEPLDAKDCYFLNWNKPANTQAFVVGCRILVPHRAATVIDANVNKRVFWVQPAQEGNAIVFMVAIAEQEPRSDGWWPGKNHGLHFVGAIQLDTAGWVCVVGHQARFQPPPPQLLPPARFFRGKSEADYASPDLRVLGMSMEESEKWGVTVVEGPAKVTAKKREEGAP